MSIETLVTSDQQTAKLQQIWVECFRSVVGQVAGYPVAVVAAGEQECAAAQAAQNKSPVWMLFTAGKSLRGEMAILATEVEALFFAQLFVSEPFDPANAFDKDRRDAYEELIRQVLGQVATALKGVTNGEVEVKPSGSDAPNWPGSSRMGIRLESEKFQPVHLVLVATAELLQSLRPASPENTASAKKSEVRAPAAPELSATENTNLELLLDVKLEATIRFGQKQMLLREILELHPGTAVALDRQVDEPVELLVGGRMVAWGEVVIVDGNYGLRITEILSPQQRIESLGT